MIVNEYRISFQIDENILKLQSGHCMIMSILKPTELYDLEGLIYWCVNTDVHPCIP